MSIFDVPPVNAPTASDGARLIRVILLRLVDQCDNGLKEVREVVNRYTRTNIETELGVDAAALQAVYSNIKSMLEDASVGRVVDTLPS